MDAAADIKSRLDVVDIVSEYLQLKPAGSGSFRACCPFHQEKTPSFYVNRPRQSWHCFGCDTGGDLISFVQKLEGMEFPEALEHLANKAGVTLPSFNPAQSSLKKRIQEVNGLAAKFYRAAFLTFPEAEPARAYATKRGIDELTGDIWQIGYAPAGWSALVEALKTRDVTEEECVQAGLASRGQNGSVYDRFRHRLMFPICDVHGNVAGFTGRVLDPEAKEAKYVNTPETLVYKKSHILYGLDKAKGAIKREDLAVIVEGNMDALTSHQYNVSNVVASSGTALTQEQLQLLKRFTNHLAIAFDADAAGQAATLRGLDLARQQDFDLKLITLPPEGGKDPDDVIRKDIELWKKAIHDALPIADWLYRRAFRNHDATRPEGKKAIADELLSELARMPHAVERDAWIVRLAKDLSISEDALRDQLRHPQYHKKDPSKIPNSQFSVSNSSSSIPNSQFPVPISKPAPPSSNSLEDLESRIWELLYLQPKLEELAQTLLSTYPFRHSPDPELLNTIAIKADRDFPEQSIDLLRRELDQTCRLWREKWLVSERARLEAEMREAERLGDQDKIQTLLKAFSSLS